MGSLTGATAGTGRYTPHSHTVSRHEIEHVRMDTAHLLLALAILAAVQTCLGFCPRECVCDDYSLEAACIKSQLEVMPMTLNPSITKLILKYNNFHSVDASFNFYPELELVDLSSNELVSIPARSFSSQRKLKELRMETNKISQLGEKTFSGLGRLEVLNLAHNLIERLDNRVFRPLRKLKELNLRENRLSEIEDRALTGLSQVRVLDLSDNLLQTVPTASLAELRLGRNNIKVVKDNSFSGLARLSLLHLGGNKIEKIHEKAFSQLRSLHQLSLSDNQLYQVPSHAFHSFDKLEILELSQNMFSVIEEEAFLGLNKLRTLQINGCSQLEQIAAGAFSNLGDLEEMVLASNRKLRLIHPQSFGSVISLRRIDLSNNGLASLSSSLLPWASLAAVDLSGNPWNCDCDVSFLKTVILSAVNRSDTVRVVRCWNPPDLRNVDVAKLELDCSVVQSPKTDHNSVSMNNTEMIAIICSSAVVISVVLVILLLKSRKRLAGCLSSPWRGRSKVPPSSGKVLQYSPYQQEPRYVSYQVVQTLRPDLRPALIVNPHSEQYFVTLKDRDKLHYLSELEDEYSRAQQQQLILGDESIYQRVDIEDPISDI